MKRHVEIIKKNILTGQGISGPPKLALLAATFMSSNNVMQMMEIEEPMYDAVMITMSVTPLLKTTIVGDKRHMKLQQRSVKTMDGLSALMIKYRTNLAVQLLHPLPVDMHKVKCGLVLAILMTTYLYGITIVHNNKYITDMTVRNVFSNMLKIISMLDVHRDLEWQKSKLLQI